MPETIVRFNDFDENLWCIYCKRRIEIGTRYAKIIEQLYSGEVDEKIYHLEDCVPETHEEADDEYVIGEE